jgi:hypothetical protein
MAHGGEQCQEKTERMGHSLGHVVRNTLRQVPVHVR